jgi:hypothetical protein
MLQEQLAVHTLPKLQTVRDMQLVHCPLSLSVAVRIDAQACASLGSTSMTDRRQRASGTFSPPFCCAITTSYILLRSHTCVAAQDEGWPLRCWVPTLARRLHAFV